MTGRKEALDEAARLLAGRARRQVPLGPLTTYRVGGSADCFVEVGDLADLAAVAEAVEATGVDVLVVGRGSNLLVADEGFPGLALTLGPAFAAVEVAGERLRAGGAASLPIVARRSAAAGLRGLEWAVGVPGSVGGGVRMNAGGHGSDIGRCLVTADVFDLSRGRRSEVERRPSPDLAFGYRRSAIGPAQVVVGAEFRLRAGSRAAAEATIAEIVRWRREHQPGGANAGSVFSNPPQDSAGRLLEVAGLKGRRRGSAFVSPRHANFFQADPGGAAGDVMALIREAQAVVNDRFGILLDTEVQLVGFSEPYPEGQLQRD